MATAPRLIKSGYGPVGSAPDFVKAARDLITRCGQWPFPWSFPPSGSEPLSMRGNIALPAKATQTNVCSFNVPVGKLGYLDSIMLTIQDGNYVEGQGMAQFAIVINQPAAQTFPIGAPANGYGLITSEMPIGNTKWPVKLPFGVLLGANDTIYIHITIPTLQNSGLANPLGVGFPSATTCWGTGWIWPETEISMVGF